MISHVNFPRLLFNYMHILSLIYCHARAVVYAEKCSPCDCDF